MSDLTLPHGSRDDETHADRAAPIAHDEDEPRFVTGDRIGRYLVVSSLGKGGMSVVYIAYDPELDRKVALKLMRVTTLGEKGKLRLQREAQALARLSHPNVVPVYDAGTVGDQVVRRDGVRRRKDAPRWLKDGRAWRDALGVLLEAGRGLAAAHAAKLVHRDFKPDNVVIGDDGRVRVLDFGLARLASVLDGTAPSSTSSLDDLPSEAAPLVPSSRPTFAELTRADQVIGTPAYMAPEQLAHESVDERADQYSFAVTLFEALYGVRPFDMTTEDLRVGRADREHRDDPEARRARAADAAARDARAELGPPRRRARTRRRSGRALAADGRHAARAAGGPAAQVATRRRGNRGGRRGRVGRRAGGARAEPDARDVQGGRVAHRVESGGPTRRPTWRARSRARARRSRPTRRAPSRRRSTRTRRSGRR